jgi:uncharacterized protein
MKIYQFQIWGKYFAVDVKSGNFFEIDKTASQALALLEQYTEKEAKERLKRRYGPKPAEATFRNLSRLKREGVLFASGAGQNTQASKKITDLTLNIVEGCNLRCRYCWNKAGVYSGSLKRPKKMNFGVAARAVDLLIKESKGAKDLVVDFYGGEPLMNFNLIRNTIEYCRKIRDAKKINFRFLLATNGTLLSKDKADFLIKNGVDVAVSIDGPRAIQDTQRPFADGSGSFDKIMKNINSLDPGYRNRMVGRATFTPYSRDVIKTFKFLRSLGFDRIEVCESEKAGYELGAKNHFFFSGPEGKKHLKSLYNKLARFYTLEIIKGNLTYENTYFNRFFKQLSRLYHLQSVVGACSAGFSLMAVDMDGSIYPCTAFVGIPEFRIGDVSTGIQDAKLNAFLGTKIDASRSCSGCWAKRICRGCGSCYNLNYFTSRNLAQPDPYYCNLFRYKTKLMIAMIGRISRENSQLPEDVFVPEYYVTRGKSVTHTN